MPFLNKTLGLALSGGGFRATLFGLGSLWRLNELGLLQSLDRITSVSGGSILAGFLGYKWNSLRFSNGIAENFLEEIVSPLQQFCSQTIDIPSGIKGFLTPFRSTGDFLTSRYDSDLFNKATMRDLPVGPDRGSPSTGPNFIIYSTNMQTGRSFRFTRDYLADYYLGLNRTMIVPLARAVAASSAFPPVFSPITLNSNPNDWSDGTQKRGDLAEFQRDIVLTDGGIYDNMGLEALIGNIDIVLVSDAGAPFHLNSSPRSNYMSQLGRVRDILIDQTRALRKRWFVTELDAKRQEGAYWGIATRLEDYKISGLCADTLVTNSLQSVRTRLNKFSPEEQGQLMNWGYVLADTAIRRYVIPSTPVATHWPAPQFAF
jgi:NTE family protein